MNVSANVDLLADCLFLEIRGYDFFLSLLLWNWSGVIHGAVGTIELDLLNGPDADYFALRYRSRSGLRFLAFCALLKMCLFAAFAALLVHASTFSAHLIFHFIQTEQFTLVLNKFLTKSAPSVEFSSRIHKEIAIVFFLLDLSDYEVLNDL